MKNKKLLNSKSFFLLKIKKFEDEKHMQKTIENYFYKSKKNSSFKTQIFSISNLLKQYRVREYIFLYKCEL